MTNEEKRIKEINEEISKIQNKNKELGKGIEERTQKKLEKVLIPVINKFAKYSKPSGISLGAFMFSFNNETATIQISSRTRNEKLYVEMCGGNRSYYYSDDDAFEKARKNEVAATKIIAKLWDKEDKILNILKENDLEKAKAETRRTEIETEIADLKEEKLYLYSKSIVCGTKYRSKYNTDNKYAWTVLKVSKENVYYLTYYGKKCRMPLFQFVNDYENGSIVKTI